MKRWCVLLLMLLGVGGIVAVPAVAKSACPEDEVCVTSEGQAVNAPLQWGGGFMSPGDEVSWQVEIENGRRESVELIVKLRPHLTLGADIIAAEDLAVRINGRKLVPGIDGSLSLPETLTSGQIIPLEVAVAFPSRATNDTQRRTARAELIIELSGAVASPTEPEDEVEPIAPAPSLPNTGVSGLAILGAAGGFLAALGVVLRRKRDPGEASSMERGIAGDNGA